jgi:hypothetical protein
MVRRARQNSLVNLGEEMCSTLNNDQLFRGEVGMANEQMRPDDDEPTEEEIERQKKQEKTWKHDDSRELSERDQEPPLKP